ncbi:uncharacterized protein LOC135500080 isoform X2 [Lineus longissimus]|uniref:uncharacterized protein LOC135500080 isoform X2 n=1 Tax=Lineus longissimus TaxID=88925 RepID=UPI00315C804C
MREPIFLLAIWTAFQLTTCRVDCPFGDGPWKAKVNRCLSRLQITGDHLLEMTLFEGKSPREIERICDTADIEKSIDCAESVLNKECKWEDVTPETRFLSFEGIKNGLLFICRNSKLQIRNQICARLQKGPYKNCTKRETKISNAILKEEGRYDDPVERICSKYRIERFCINAIYRDTCGSETSDFKTELNELITPPTCDCKTQSFLRSQDRGECVDRSGCLFHIQKGMTERDLDKGMLFAAKDLKEVWQMCSHSEEEHTTKFAEAMDCVEESNNQCNYNVMKYKQQKTTVDDLREAAFFMCDRWQILVTKEQKEGCLFSKLDEYNNCVTTQTKAELKTIRHHQKDDLKTYLCKEYRAKVKCIYKTFSECSMVLANVLEGVLMRKQPPICRRCTSRGTFPYRAGATTNTVTSSIIVILGFFHFIVLFG